MNFAPEVLRELRQVCPLCRDNDVDLRWTPDRLLTLMPIGPARR